MNTHTISLAKVKEGDMTKTHELLLALLTTEGQTFLSNLLGLGPTEISRKVMGETGWTLKQLAASFDALGITIVPPGSTVIDIKKYEALVRLANDALTAQVAGFDGVQRRRATPPTEEGG